MWRRRGQGRALRIFYAQHRTLISRPYISLPHNAVGKWLKVVVFSTPANGVPTIAITYSDVWNAAKTFFLRTVHFLSLSQSLNMFESLVMHKSSSLVGGPTYATVRPADDNRQ